MKCHVTSAELIMINVDKGVTVKKDRTRILYIESSQAEALKMREDFAREGQGRYELDRADSLSTALAKLDANDYDVALTDIKLPDVVSLKVVSSLLQVNEDLPVVVISDEADEDVALQTVNHGAQDYLIKSRADAYLVSRALHKSAMPRW